MPSFKSIFATAAFLAAAVNAKTVTITAKSDNRFDPDSTTADKGDMLEFHFQGSKNSVVAGDYQYPCSPVQIGTGFFSGLVDGDGNRIFRVQVNDTDPLVFYSSQGTECASGMVGIVNPSGDKTLDDYKSRASKLSTAVSPGNATFGGELADQDNKKGGTDDKENSADTLQVSAVALSSILGAVLYML